MAWIPAAPCACSCLCPAPLRHLTSGSRRLSAAAQVVRLPLLRHRVHAWMGEHGLPAPNSDPSPETLAAADPRCPGWVAELRSGDVARRGTKAAARINDALIEWGRDTEAEPHVKAARAAAMEVGGAVLAPCISPRSWAFVAAGAGSLASLPVVSRLALQRARPVPQPALPAHQWTFPLTFACAALRCAVLCSTLWMTSSGCCGEPSLLMPPCTCMPPVHNAPSSGPTQFCCLSSAGCAALSRAGKRVTWQGPVLYGRTPAGTGPS